MAYKNKDYMKIYSRKNRKRIRKYQLKYKQTEKGKLNYQINNKKRKFIRHNITPEKYLLMLNSQENKCLICGEIMEHPQIDHNHKTNKIRGLLCRNCNLVLGLTRENTATLLRAIDYLNRYEKM